MEDVFLLGKRHLLSDFLIAEYPPQNPLLCRSCFKRMLGNAPPLQILTTRMTLEATESEHFLLVYLVKSVGLQAMIKKMVPNVKRTRSQKRHVLMTECRYPWIDN